MNTLNGYSKSTLTDSNVLSAAGGHLPLVAGRLWRSWTSVTIEEANVVWYIKVELPGYSKPSSMLIYGSYNNIDDLGLVEFSGFSKGYIYRNINQNGGNVTAVCMSSVYDSTTKKWTFWIKMRPINNSSDYYAPDLSATYLIYFSESYTITATATTTDPGVEWLSTSTNLVINNAALIGTATTATAAVSANKIPVTQNTNTDAEWPIVWSNQNNTNSVTDNLLYKSYNNLTYNPKNQRITALLFRGSLGDGTITVKGERNNEINFGGTNASTTIYFGYRATDSKPIPSQFVFGSSTGTAEILASKFTKAGGTSALFLKADGSVDSNTYLTQHQSLANYVTLNTNLTITGTKTFSKVINIANSGGSLVSGMTNAAIKYDSLNALNTGNYHPIIGVKTNGENVVNFGAYVNSVGFYGYKKGRTANDTDWIFTFNSETGAITHTGTNIKATKFIKSGGTSAQFLKADGSIDSNTYATTTQLGNYIPLAPTKFSQYKAGNWTKILTFTIPVNSFTPSISFTWHPTECARYAWSDFNINIRSGAIIFMANWKGDEVRTLKCVGDGTTYNVWVYGIKEGYDPYGSLQVTSTYNIISYQAGSLAYLDADPTGTYTADATKYGAVSSADKLSTVSKTAWGLTYWTSGGVPTSISGNISSTGNITPSATHTYTLGSSSLVYERVYCRYIDTDSGYNLRLCALGSEKISINAANGCVGINNTSPTHQLTVSGTGYFTGQVRIDGSVASLPLVVRGIVGQNGSGTVGELYLQYGANNAIFLGNTAAYTISADGSKYSGNAATSSRLSEYYELNRNKDSEIIAPKDMPLGMFIRFKNNTGAEYNGGWNTVVAMNAFTGASSSGAGYRHEFLFSDSLNHSDGTFYVRNGVDNMWNPWRKVLTDYNWTSTIDLSSYATKTYVDTAIANALLGGSSPDLELYFRPTYVNGAGFSFASNTSGNAFAIYAPTSAGASNLILISTGSTPSWTNLSNLSVGNSTRLNGQAASYYATTSSLDNYFKKTGGTITGTLAVSNTATFYNEVRIANSFNPYMSFVSSSTSEMVSSIYGVTDYNTTSKVYPYGARILFRLYSVSAANTANSTISTSGYEDYILGPCDTGLTSRVAYNIYTEKNKQSVVSLIGTTDNSDLPLVFTNGVNTSTTSEIFKLLYVNTNKLLLAFNPNSKTLKIHGGNTSGILLLCSNTASVSLSCSGQGILNTPKGFRAVSSDTTPGSLTLGSTSGSTQLLYNTDTNDSGVVVKLPAKEGVLATLDMIKWAVYYVSTGSSSYTKLAGNHNFISSATQAGVNTGCAFNISYPNGFSYTNTIISASFGNNPDSGGGVYIGKTISILCPTTGTLGIYVGGYDTNGVHYSSLAGCSVKIQFICFNNI